MEYKTIDELGNIILGFDIIGGEYFVWNKFEHQWYWFETLKSASETFNLLTNGKAHHE